jgi:HipA-like protein
MLAYLHREESLPSKRHRLFQKVLERMAEHWDANKGLPERPSAERFELEDKLAFLRALAWQMQSEPRTAGNAIGRSELEDFAAGFCEKRWGQPRDAARRRAEALIHQLHARNGVLSYLGADTFGFAHRAFMELLAASEAVERFRSRQWEESALNGVFAAHWPDSKWKETLLLTCGLLQEDADGPARVVRVLQGIGEGRIATIYSTLDNYLVFCIKALGELQQLETGAPGDFARAINDILIVQIRDDVLSERKFTPAFRRCAGRWPDVGSLEAAMVARVASNDHSAFVLHLYETWIAAGGRLHRAELLVRAVETNNIAVAPFAVCTEAARFGPWSNEEMNAVLDTASHRDELDQFNVATSIAMTKGSRWNEQSRPIQILWKLASKASTEDVRVRSAWILLRTGKHADAVKDILLQGSRSANKFVAREAALCLADQGLGDLVVETLACSAESDDSSLIELIKLADRLLGARDHLKKAIVAVRAADDPRVLPNAARATWRRGLKVFEEEEILERWRKIKDLSVRQSHIDWFQFVPGAERLMVRGWLEIMERKPKDISVIAWHSDAMTPQQVGPLLFELWRRILDYKLANYSIPLAAQILLLYPGITHLPLGVEFRAHAEHIRQLTLHESAPEEVRLQAAQNFRHTYPSAQKVLEDLAANAHDEWVRWNAARFAGNLASLNEILSRTTSDQLRANVRHALDLYGEINSLLQVGKLRRARVRFEGRDAGILEEMTRVGNGTRFQYDGSYDGPPIAPNMPLGKPYQSEETLLPFFANLLPQGTLYEQTARHLGLKREDRFGVLLRVGGDTMGAVEVLPMETA